MKIGLLIFIGLLILWSKYRVHWAYVAIGACWGGNPVPFSIKVKPFIINVLISLLLVGLFTAILFGFTLKSLAIMWLIELITDIVYFILSLIERLYWNIRTRFRDAQ